MSIDPPRLRDDPSVPGDLQDLVASAAAPPLLDPLIKARSLAQLGVGSAVTATGVKLWLLIGGLGAAVATGVVVTSATSSSSTTSSASPERLGPITAPAEPILETPEAESLSLAASPVFLELEESAAPMPERTQPRGPAVRRSGAAEAPADTLLLEAGILEEARLLLATNPQGTLNQTRRHAREYPRGQLRAERELIAIDALTRLGRRGSARLRASALLERSPSGIYAERARRILDGLAAP
jgi:hypothetical protein